MIDPESAVLGAVLVDASAYWRVADLLTAEDFANGGHRRLWGVIADMSRAGSAVDCITVGEREPGLEQLAFECGSTPCAIANVRTYAELVAKRATERRVIAAGQRIAGLRGDDTLGEAQRILSACSPRNSAAVRHVKTVLAETSREMIARFEAQETLTGVGTSLPTLDAMTSGWQPSDLIVLGARPSLGKTALALQCALHAAGLAQPVLFFSAEMAGRQLTDRALAHVSRVSLADIRCPKQIGDGWDRITRASLEISDMPLWIDDSSGMTVDAICARSRQVDAERRLGLIVIDYLTHLSLPKAEKITDAVQIVTRTLKGLAKQLKVPVLLLSQLNRDGDHAPTLTSLRESGAIEQDADVVAFLHRPDPARRDVVQLLLRKQRNGECGEIWLHADMARMRFTETEAPHVEPIKARSGFRSGGFGSARDRAAGGQA